MLSIKNERYSLESFNIHTHTQTDTTDTTVMPHSYAMYGYAGYAKFGYAT